MNEILGVLILVLLLRRVQRPDWRRTRRERAADAPSLGILL
jgi:hypothetical protein